METRANHVWVGVVTLMLIALLAGFAVWVARMNQGHRNRYDIYFHQSVDGLSKGSDVSYAGVPAGQVLSIHLWKKDPSYVRVRVALDTRIPILQGTTATIQGSFTGISTIQLAGGVKGSPPITGQGPDGVPVIPTSRSGLGALLSSAPVLMEKLSTLTDRLSDVLSEQNQRQIAGILANTNRISGNLADASPQLKGTLADLQVTLQQATRTLAEAQQTAHAANTLLGPDGNSLASQMRATMSAARVAAETLQVEISELRAPTRQLSQTTLPQAEAALRELRVTNKALRDLVEKVDDKGAGAVLAAPKLPEYKP